MRILVRIATVRMYVCHHDIHVYCNIQILYLRILESLNEVHGYAYWSGSSLSVCMYVIMIYIATYRYYIKGYGRLWTKCADAHTGQDRHCPHVCMSSWYTCILRHTDIILKDMGDSERSARMHILARIVTVLMYVCPHDILQHTDIILAGIGDSDRSARTLVRIVTVRMYLCHHDRYYVRHTDIIFAEIVILSVNCLQICRWTVSNFVGEPSPKYVSVNSLVGMSFVRAFFSHIYISFQYNCSTKPTA